MGVWACASPSVLTMPREAAERSAMWTKEREEPGSEREGKTEKRGTMRKQRKKDAKEKKLHLKGVGQHLSGPQQGAPMYFGYMSQNNELEEFL